MLLWKGRFRKIFGIMDAVECSYDSHLKKWQILRLLIVQAPQIGEVNLD